MLVLNRVATGSWVGTSIADKSLVATYGSTEALALVTDFLIDVVRGLLLGFYPSQAPIGFSRGWAPLFFPPLGLLLVLLALARPAPRAWGRAAVGGHWSAVCAAGRAQHVHGHPFQSLPALGLPRPAGPGGRRAARAEHAARTRRHTARRSASSPPAPRSSWCSGAVHPPLRRRSTATWRATSHRRDLAAAEWIKRELPPGAAIANLATSVEYLTGHRSLNLHGVTTPGVPRQPAGGARGRRVRGARRASPPPSARRSSWPPSPPCEGAPALRELVVEPALFRTSSFSDEIVVLRTQYGPLDGADEPRLPETLEAVRA